MNESVCAECGRQLQTGELTHQVCDGCGKTLCPECYSSIITVHTTRPTAMGMTGFLKLCKECRETYKDVIKSLDRPYLG